LWKNLSLPEDLKPRLQYKAMLSQMGFSVEDYTIYVNKRLAPFKMDVRNKTGKNKANLRHEIEHVKQTWDVIRLLGADKFAEIVKAKKIPVISEIKPNIFKKIKKIEQTFGRITPDSNEGKIASSYLDAMCKYTDVNVITDPVTEVVNHIKYKNNLLEKGANLAAKEYEPSFLKNIKVTFKEFTKLLTKQE